MNGDGKDLLKLAQTWRRDGHQVTLASVLATWGSAPRPSGSLLIIRDDGVFAGSVSGGCVEGDVIAASEDVLSTGVPRVLDYGVSNDMAWEVGLACGGKISILLEPFTYESPLPIPPFAALHSTQKGLVSLISADEDNPSITQALKSDRAQVVEADGETWFINPFNSPLRLILIGAVHIAQTLIPMAQQAGYQVIVIDPRSSFANAQRFKGIEVLDNWPDEGLKTLNIDARTAIVTLTHDPKLDDAALLVALGSNAFYIGSLGSKKTHAARLERLRGKGFDEAALARIHGPVGLAIGARSPGEIAISILAQMTAVLRGAE